MSEKKCSDTLLIYGGINENMLPLTSRVSKSLLHMDGFLFPCDHPGCSYFTVFCLCCILGTNALCINIRDVLWGQPSGAPPILSAAIATGGTTGIYSTTLATSCNPAFTVVKLEMSEATFMPNTF